MSKTINAIRGLLNLPDLHKFYAEARLDDGRLVVTEAEAMEVGVEVRIMSDEGSAEEMSDGEYTLEDGTLLAITDNRIAQLGEEDAEAEADVEVEVTEEALASDKKEEDYSKLRKELGRLGLTESQQLDVMKAVLAGLEGAVEEVEEKIDIEEMSELKEFAEEVSAAFETVFARLSAMESQPASEGVSVSPAPSQRPQEPVNLSSMKTSDRAHWLMSQMKNNQA